MTRIKICGITNVADAQAAIAFGADALGFIAVPSSPRYITPETYAEIASALPPFVSRVVVVQKIENADQYSPDYIQYYEESSDKSRLERNIQLIRSFRMRDTSSLEEIESFSTPVAAYHLDTYHKDKLGGSGETFNWELAVEAVRRTNKPIMLAGGLTPENIQDALSTVRPYAVDLSSGIESSPGVKNIARMREFIRKIREWDLNLENEVPIIVPQLDTAT